MRARLPSKALAAGTLALALAITPAVASAPTPSAATTTATTPAPTPAPTTAAEASLPSPPISARSAVVIEASTGLQLAGRDPDEQLPMASTTKLMTALIVLEYDSRRLGEVVSAPGYAAGPNESLMGLQAGERISIADLMRGMLLPSANDAAHALAVVVGGSVDNFVAIMNRRARHFGLTNTHYDSPVGLDDPGTYSSADDLVHLATVDRHFPFFRRTVDTRVATIGLGDERETVISRNDLLGAVPWINGVKTGHTSAAGYVLVGSGTAHGVTLISAVMGDPDMSSRDADTLAMLRFGFGQVRVYTPVRAGAIVASRPVNGHSGQRIGLVATRTISGVIRRGLPVERVFQAPAVLHGPLAAGTQVGELVVRSGGRKIGSSPLRVQSAVPAPPGILSGPVAPAALLAFVVLGGGTLVGVRRRHDARVEGPARQRGGGSRTRFAAHGSEEEQA